MQHSPNSPLIEFTTLTRKAYKIHHILRTQHTILTKLITLTLLKVMVI